MGAGIVDVARSTSVWLTRHYGCGNPSRVRSEINSRSLSATKAKIPTVNRSAFGQSHQTKSTPEFWSLRRNSTFRARRSDLAITPGRWPSQNPIAMSEGAQVVWGRISQREKAGGLATASPMMGYARCWPPLGCPDHTPSSSLMRRFRPSPPSLTAGAARSCGERGGGRAPKRAPKRLATLTQSQFSRRRPLELTAAESPSVTLDLA